MPSKEIKELRQAGKLAEAYAMAKSELETEPGNIWGKRNLSWVLYAQLDELASNLDTFLAKIKEVKELDLPASEEMFYENICIVISKAARNITHEATIDINKMHRLFDSIKGLPLKRNSKWFSVLFNAMHKGMKESNRYIEFADWWDFKNFKSEDFEKEKMPNGKEIMAIVEQAYIAYAKHLLPKQTQNGEIIFDRQKAENFLPELSRIAEDYPQFQYPPYFTAKLLLAIGDKDNMLKSLLPFAKKKRNDFWVWEILAEAFSADQEKVLACYCKALSCKSPEEMLVNLRQKMAKLLIERKLYNEAKTEIELLIRARNSKGFNTPAEVLNWQSASWYKSAVAAESNFKYYRAHLTLADSILFSDVSEELIIVEFVNSDRKILNFIASEEKFGFFKYDRFLSGVNLGDILKVRLQGGSKNGAYQLYTATKVIDDDFRNKFIRPISGKIKMSQGRAFGFIDDVYIHPSLVKKYSLTDGADFSGNCIKTYNQEKNKWTWKLI